MKEVLYNYDYLNENDINRYVKRAKLLVENSNNEILIAHSNKNYFLIGGHVEDGESFDECIVREIKEEAGVDIPFEERKPFFVIKYFNKDYPNKGQNTASIINYYSVKYDLIPNLENTNLTDEEKAGGFELKYINKNDIINVLTQSLDSATRVGVTKDTIAAITEYLNIN